MGVAVSREVLHEDGEGTPTVFIHGVGSSREAWDHVIEHLELPGPIVRYDLRGHGQSPKLPGPYELDDFVEDHVALLADLGIAMANVVGFSLGGLIAQAIALRRPETVERLVIVGAIAGRSRKEWEAVAARLALVEKSGPAGVAAQGGQRWFTDDFASNHPEAVERMLGRLAANDRVSYEASYRVLATNDLVGELHRITAPTLVMTGEGDVGSPPRMARLMAFRIPNAELVIIEKTKHGMLEERPVLVAQELRRFLSATNESGQLRAAGLAVRREVLGDEYVDRALKHVDPLSAEFQNFITQYCWGEIWTDDRLTRRDRSLLTLGMTAALGRTKELEAHTHGALRNGITAEELVAVLRQITVYCGVPAGVSAAAAMRSVLTPAHDGPPVKSEGAAPSPDGHGSPSQPLNSPAGAVTTDRTT